MKLRHKRILKLAQVNRDKNSKILHCSQMKQKSTCLHLMLSNIWHCHSEIYKEKHPGSTFKHDGGNVMVWSCMCSNSTGELHFIQSSMNS